MTDIPHEKLSRRAMMAIESLGRPVRKWVVVKPGDVNSLEALAKRTYRDILFAKNCGPATACEIEALLAEHGLRLSGDIPKWYRDGMEKARKKRSPGNEA